MGRSFDEFLDTVRANITKHGVHITWVGPGDNGEPPFAYTTGLAERDQPEFAIYGLPPEVSQPVLNTLAFSVIRDGQTYDHGDTVHHVVNGYPVRLIRMDDTTEDLTVSNRFARPDQPVTALQVTFPDREGRWPWQDGSTVAALRAKGPVPGDADGKTVTLPD